MKTISEVFGLASHVSVVAGANGRLGRASADALRACGAKVVRIDIEFDGDTDDLQVRVDLTSDSGLDHVFDEVLPQIGLPGIVNWSFVHCAYPRSTNWSKLRFENVSRNDFDENVRLQLGSTFEFARRAVVFMKNRGGGALVTFGSTYGLVGPDNAIYAGTEIGMPSPYAAIKGGVVGITRFIATTYGKDNIRANVVCPGGILAGQPESFVRAYERRTPLGRMGNPEDIAGIIALLVGPCGRYITGAVIPIDGGWTAW